MMSTISTSTVPIITLERAKLHLRIDNDDEDALIAGQLAAAQAQASSWIRRLVFATQEDLTNAQAATPAAIRSAFADHSNAMALAQQECSEPVREAVVAAANMHLQTVMHHATLTRNGCIVNDMYVAAVLLTLGALYADREHATLPQAAMHLLQPMRVY